MNEILVGLCIVGLVVVLVVKEVVAYKERIALSKIQKATNVGELEYIFNTGEEQEDVVSELVDIADIPDIEQ